MKIAFTSIRLLLLVLTTGLSLSGCGPGLCPGGNACFSSGATVSPRLALSGLDGLTIRKNDCYPVTVQALDAAGQAMTDVTASVTIAASTGVALYSSLLGCQTYDSATEQSTFFIAPSSPQAVFYFRSDVDGAVSLSASASSLTALTDASQPVSVAYAAFDGASGPNSAVQVSVQDGSGRTYLGGYFTTYDDTAANYIARLNSDGSLDTSFAPTGTGLNNWVYSLSIQSDGKILVGGWFTSYNGTSRRRIARLNTDGSLDTTFAQTGTGLNGAINAISLQADGKVLVGGAFTSYNGTSQPYIARLNSDGSLDATFATTGTGLNSDVLALSLQADGKIVAGGYFTSYNGTSRPRIARLNSDGSLDTSFAPTGTGLNGGVSAISLQADGKVLAGGGFTSYNGTSRPRIARLNSDGSLDTSFAQTGTGLNDDVLALSIQADGKVFVAGEFTSYNGTSRPYIARLDSDGLLDTSFAPTGTGLNDFVRALSLQADGKVLVGGLFASYDGTSQPRIARLNSDGSLDTSVAQTGTGLNNTLYALSVQADGKVCLGGAFTSYNGTSRPRIARLNADGSLDTSFALTGTGLNNDVLALSIQADGKVLVGGLFTSYNGTSRPYIARMNSDGSLDTSFAPTGTGLNNYVLALSIQADGKVLVGGLFTSYNGTSRPYIARINADGSLDTSFAQTGTGLNTTVRAIFPQADGKVLVGGDFTSYNGTSRPRVARLNADGSLDTSFAPTGTGLNSIVYALSLQADGKVLVGGGFISYNGTSRPSVARLNADGSLDTSFAPTGTGLNSIVYALSVQTNGKVVVGGDLTSYNGTSRPRVARLNADGSLDTSFAATGTGLNSTVWGLSLQADGKVVAGGAFTSYGVSTASYMVRLTYIGTLD